MPSVNPAGNGATTMEGDAVRRKIAVIRPPASLSVSVHSLRVAQGLTFFHRRLLPIPTEIPTS